MRDLADEPAPKIYTGLTVILMVLATLVAVTIGFASFGLYLPNLMTFSQVLGQDSVDKAALAAFLFLSAGPVIAAAGLILGWISFTAFKAPKTGIRLVFFPPVIWVVAVLVYFAVITSACDGRFTCGVSL